MYTLYTLSKIFYILDRWPIAPKLSSALSFDFCIGLCCWTKMLFEYQRIFFYIIVYLDKETKCQTEICVVLIRASIKRRAKPLLFQNEWAQEIPRMSTKNTENKWQNQNKKMNRRWGDERNKKRWSKDTR